MDELISQLRSTQHPSVGDGEDETPQDPLEPEDSRDTDMSHDTSTGREMLENVHDPTSSQGQTSFHMLKLDFDMLRQVREERGARICVADIRRSKKYKIDEVFAVIVRKLDRFSKDVTRMELVDEDGVISGSCLSGVVNEFGVRPGSIMILCRFSLWKTNGNHLNITAANIEEVI